MQSDYRKTCKVATANRIYRADFQRKAVLRRLPDEFTLDELAEVLSDVEFKQSWYRDGEPAEVTLAVARNYARDLKYKGLLECKHNGPYPGTWRKI